MILLFSHEKTCCYVSYVNTQKAIVAHPLMKETIVSSSQDILRQLDESPLSSFHWKTVITSGMGFFTDAYDLFIIGVVISILRPLWHPSALDISLLGSTALLSAALGSIIFGRLADMLGRKFVY